LLKLALELVGDLIITITLGITLYRSRTDFKATNSIINRLLLMVVETQLPPTILAAAFLAMLLDTSVFDFINFFG
jgi:hypothetical protein